ncbi:MAG TPA: hypothetical protein PLR71_11255 [Deltaproteobacteria bacterium]|nr:hypothetical protein [Deltaproteobacteria bacterium]HQI82120.1 hypothetical protein [Deltaproteobacteria bacterium]
MRKTPALLLIVACLIFPASALGMEVTVEITGPPELTALKPGIEKTIPARCMSTGIDMKAFGRLAVTITALGDVISYDAVLDTTPPRAFHRDIRDASALSGTIDEMIKALFAEHGAVPGSRVPAVQPPQARESLPRVRLPFMATSIAAAGERTWVSDESTVYELTGDETTPVWKATGNNRILRIYHHEGSIIVLAKIMDTVQTFRIHGTELAEKWHKAVIPLGNGLISTGLTFDTMIYRPTGYQWSRAVQTQGSSPQIPEGLDILSATAAELRQSSPGPEILSYDTAGRMVLSDGKSVLWTDEEDAGITPQYIEQERADRGYGEGEIPARYSLRPRAVVFGDRIVTFRNNQGMARIVSRSNLFESAEVVLFTPSAEGFTRSELASIPRGYCVDIAVTQNKAAVLVVQDKNAFVQYIGL